MYKEDLALKNLQWLMCQPNQTSVVLKFEQKIPLGKVNIFELKKKMRPTTYILIRLSLCLYIQSLWAVSLLCSCI